jgi:hypothetical protein
MSPLSAQSMASRVTLPYRRGAETFEVPFLVDTKGVTPVDSVHYEPNFQEYRARYQADPPEPRYVLYLKTVGGTGDLDVEVGYLFAGAMGTATVRVPAGTLAGSSFAIPLPPHADATLRITSFRQLPVSLPDNGRDHFGIVVLLGNVAKLAWVIGGEKDQLRAQLERTQLQRHVEQAAGFSLDALGADLRVPRFPARAYSFDGDTLALYHLDDAVPDGGTVADETSRFGLPGHPARNKGGSSGTLAKFGNGLRIPGPSGVGALEILSHPDFDMPAERSFTVELFLEAEAVSGPAPAVVALKGALDGAGVLTSPGWSLTLGSFRGFGTNLRWAGSDGVRRFELFADVDLADAAFHHVAGVIDRTVQTASLAVDGSVVARTVVGALGALTNAESVRIGRSATAHQLAGIVDEIRLSSVARREFDPVLGEGDGSYRRRLAIFRRWRLPSAAELLRTINGMIKINGQPDSFVLIEKDRPGESASALLRVLPAALGPGQSITADGDPLGGEPEDTPDFRAMYLVRHDRAGVDYGADDNHHRMQAALRRALDSLLDLLAADPPVAGTLKVNGAFDPDAEAPLQRIGRALLLGHSTLPPEKLAVFAHRAGFDFVRNDGTQVYTSVAAGEELDIVIEPRPVSEIPLDGSDAFAGRVLDLHIDPATLPPQGSIRWVLIACGAGRATLLAHPADPPTLKTPVTARSHVRLRADAPGAITVRVEHTLDRRTATGTRELTFTIDQLADGQTIAGDGTRAAVEADVSGSPERVNEIYLVTPALPFNFGADPNHKRMQIVLEKPLIRLAALIGKAGAPAANLEVLKCFDPADPGLHRAGRAIRLRHAGLAPEVLGALVHQAGLAFVSRSGNEIYGSVPPGPKVEIAQGGTLAPLSGEVTVGSPADLEVRFTAKPAAGSYNWSVQPAGLGRGSLDFLLRPKVKLTPTRPGLLELNATYLEDDAGTAVPYTFEIRLKPSLDVPETVILKAQYDLLMNILNYFHPIGVEVVTRKIREHVVEIKDDLLAVFPGYTYPDFRM